VVRKSLSFKKTQNYRIELTSQISKFDSMAHSLQKNIEKYLGIHITDIRSFRSYYLTLSEDSKKADTIAQKIFLDPIVDSYTINKISGLKDEILVEIRWKQGVTDNEGKTAMEQISLFLGRKIKDNEFVSSAKGYYIKGISDSDAAKISDWISNSLVNDTIIQSGSIKIKNFLKYEYSSASLAVNSFDLGNYSKSELDKFSKKRLLALTSDELQVFWKYFTNKNIIAQRKKYNISLPTDVELEAFAQTQSEHCKHKIFNAIINYKENNKVKKINSIFKTYIEQPTISYSFFRYTFGSSAVSPPARIIPVFLQAFAIPPTI